MIKCKNVFLKTLEREDLPDIYKILLQEDIGNAFSTTYQELTLNNLGGYLLSACQGTTTKAFTIRRYDKIIGFVSLKDICPIKRSAEIGELAMIKKYQKPREDAFLNASYAIEAAGTLMIYAFEVLNLHKLYAYTFSNNPDVNNLYKTGGWTIEGKAK